MDIQIIPGKVRHFSRHLTEAHPQVLIIAPPPSNNTAATMNGTA
jgi:hypothetical protein